MDEVTKFITEVTQQLDYDLSQKERVELTKKLLYPNGKLHPFLEEYLSNYYNPHISTDDPLSEHNEVFKALSKIADYILFSPDGERITKRTKYNFYTDKKLKDNMKKEISLEKMVEEAEDETNEFNVDPKIYDAVIPFIVGVDNDYKKYKKVIKQYITKKDLRDPELQCVRDYQELVLLIRKLLKWLQKHNKDVPMQKRLRFLLKELKTDQVLAKDMIKGTIYFKRLSPESTVIDYDQFDFFNEQHVMALLKCPPVENLMTDLGCLIYDLNRLLEKCELNKLDWDVLTLYRQEDMTVRDIADKLGIKFPFVWATLKKICNRIIDAYEDQMEDWYYLNVVKGKYKKCSRCGEIKIANERNFGRHPNTVDGLQSVCKKCDVLRKNN